jgi:hypothetical protein
LDDLRRAFPPELIKNVCTLSRKKEIIPGKNYYLGVDVAGLGSDQTTYEVIEKINKECFEQRENIVEKNNYTTETTRQIINLEDRYCFKKIGVDDGGIGFGVFSELLYNDKTKRKVIPLNNSSRAINRDETKHTKILKNDLYVNLIALMEQGKIKLLDDDEIALSLASVQYEYIISEGKKTRLEIYGNNTHIVEGLIRAAWLAAQDKSLNLFIK